jgi:hypothetical protein
VKKAKRRLVLAKDTIAHLDPKGLASVVGGGMGCTGPRTARTANDCSGNTYTGESNACTSGTDSGFCGPSLYCTLIQP